MIHDHLYKNTPLILIILGFFFFWPTLSISSIIALILREKYSLSELSDFRSYGPNCITKDKSIKKCVPCQMSMIIFIEVEYLYLNFTLDN